jgi:hypothetical protein
MPKADFITKLREIEEQAHAVIVELAPGISRNRLQHIVLLAKTLRGRLELGVVAMARIEPLAPARGPGQEPPA